MTRWRLRVWTRFFETPERVWAQKTDLDAIQAEFPAWMPFSITNGEGLLQGEPAVARLGLMKWPIRVTSHVPGERFVDESDNALFAEFVHEHRVERTSDGCRYIDDVQFVPRLASKATALALQRVFILRHTRAAKTLEVDARTVGTAVLRSEPQDDMAE